MKNHKKSITTGAVLVVLGAFTSTFGTVLIDDNFEANTGAGKDPVGWNVSKNPGDSIAVVRDNAPGTTGSKAVELINGDAASNQPNLRRYFNMGNSTLRIEFDYRYSDETASPNLRLFSSNKYAANLILSWDSPKDVHAGKMRYSNAPGSYVTLGSPLVKGIWYHVALSMDDSGKLVVRVTDRNGFDETYPDLELRNGYDVEDLDRLDFRFISKGTGGAYTIDNVAVGN